MGMFRSDELELLICGNPVLEFEALESVAQYEDGFDSDSITVQQFWKVWPFDFALKVNPSMRLETFTGRARI